MLNIKPQALVCQHQFCQFKSDNTLWLSLVGTQYDLYKKCDIVYIPGWWATKRFVHISMFSFSKLANCVLTVGLSNKYICRKQLLLCIHCFEKDCEAVDRNLEFMFYSICYT